MRGTWRSCGAARPTALAGGAGSPATGAGGALGKAEAIEDEEQTKNRMATLAKNQEEDQIMISELPWPEIAESSEIEEKNDYVKEWTIGKRNF